MRRILINYAKARNADKRGGGDAAVTLNDEIMPGFARTEELLDLDRALEKLAALNDRQARRNCTARAFVGTKAPCR